MLIVLGAVSFYIYKTVSSLDTITGVNKDTVEVGVFVRQDDNAQTMQDAAGYSFGILSELDRSTWIQPWNRSTMKPEVKQTL